MSLHTRVRLSAEREKILQDQSQVSKGKTVLSHTEIAIRAKVLLLEVSTLLPAAL